MSPRLLAVAAGADRDVTRMNAVRALANFFGRRVLTKAICTAERVEAILDCLASIMETGSVDALGLFGLRLLQTAVYCAVRLIASALPSRSRGQDSRQGDLRKSCLAVLFNFAIMFREDSQAHEGAKAQTLSRSA